MATQVSGAAVRLLHELLQTLPGGRVFSSDEAVAAGAEVGLSSTHTYKLLSELTGRGILERPRGRLYVMRPPFGGAMPVPPIAIAVRAAEPAAVSGETALAHWGLLDQAPLHEEIVSTPARIQWTHGIQAEGTDRLWTVAGTTIRFRHVPRAHMFGITRVHLDGETVVPMFDRERAIVELLTQPEQGSVEWAAELIQAHRRAIDPPRLRSYAGRVGATKQLARLLPPRKRQAAPVVLQ